MNFLITVVQVLLSFLVVTLILLQPPAEDAGASASFTNPQISKRGWEKVTFIFTLSMVAVFICFSLLRLIVAG